MASRRTQPPLARFTSSISAVGRPYSFGCGAKRMSDHQSKQPPLSERVFENSLITIPWVLFLVCLFVVVGIPFAKALVVIWVKGTDAYFHHGIRIPKGKHPLHFTDGGIVPELPCLLAFFAVFMAITGGLSLLLIYLLRFYERRFKKR